MGKDEHKIAAIYSRKSKFTGKGESIGNQVQFCKEYAATQLKDKNITEFLIYEDEGFSGGNINRPEFQKLMDDSKAKKFDILICYRLDRISRNVADFSTTLETLQKYDIDFVSIREQFDTSTPMGRAMIYIASVFAQLERETIAERVRDNMLELSKTGRWLGGQTPLGFESEKFAYIDDEFKERSMYKLYPVKEEMDIVKLMFSKYLETGSIHMVLQYLLNNNIKGKNGGEYASMSVADILRNPVYVKSDDNVINYLKNKGINICGTPNGNGILIYNKKNSKNKYKDTTEWFAAISKHKGVISSEQFIKVQICLDKNSKKHNPRLGTSKKSLLSGILKCAVCGSPMRISYGREKKDGSEKIYYYMCNMKAMSAKHRCNNPNVRGDYLEKQVIDKLKSLNTDIVIKELENYKKELASMKTSSLQNNIKKNIEEKRKEMDTLIYQLSKLDKSIASDFIVKKIEALGEEIVELEQKEKKLQYSKTVNDSSSLNINIILETLNNFNTFFNSVDSLKNDEETIIKKRYLIEMLVDKITWDGRTETIDIELWGFKKKNNSWINNGGKMSQFSKACMVMTWKINIFMCTIFICYIN